MTPSRPAAGADSTWSDAWWVPVVGLAMASSGLLLATRGVRPDGDAAVELHRLALHTALVLVPLVAVAWAGRVRRVRATTTLVASLALPPALLFLLPDGLRALQAASNWIPLAIALAVVTAALRPADGTAARTPPAAGIVGPALLAVALTAASHPLAAVGFAASQRMLVGVAVVAAAGLVLLVGIWGRHGLWAGIAVLVVAGATPFAALAMVAVGLLERLARRIEERNSSGPSGADPRTMLLGATTLAALAGAFVASPVALLLPMVTWARRGRRGWFAALVVTAGIAFLALPPRPWIDVGRGALLLVALLSFAIVRLLTTASSRSGDHPRQLRLDSEGLWRLAAGFVLAVVGLRVLEPVVALLPTAVLWLSPPGADGARADGDATPEPGPAERFWLGLCLVGIGVATAYPWLRPPGAWRQAEAQRLLADLDASDHLVRLAVVALAALATAWAARRFEGRARLLPTAVTGLALLGVGIWSVALDGPRVLQRWPPIVLTDAAPSATLPLPELDAGAPLLRVDSFLANALALPPATVVARFEARPAGQEGVWVGALRAGRETAEWRIDPATADPETPEAFGFWWSAGDPVTLGRRYRSSTRLRPAGPGQSDTGSSPGTLVVRRAEELPPSVELRIDRVAISVGRPAERGRDLQGEAAGASPR